VVRAESSCCCLARCYGGGGLVESRGQARSVSPSPSPAPVRCDGDADVSADVSADSLLCWFGPLRHDMPGLVRRVVESSEGAGEALVECLHPLSLASVT
jgi:hypothetical protein